MRAYLVIALVAVAACDTKTVPGPTVSVFKQQAGGFALISSTCPSADLDLDADIDPTCSMTGAPTLYAGLDLVEIIIDYGTVDFSAVSPPTAPTVTITVDGAPTMTTTSVQMRTPPKGRNYYVATFVAPPSVSGDVAITVSAGAGFSTNVETVFQTVAPPAVVSVLKRMPTGCYAPMTPATPDPQLGLQQDLCVAPVAAETTLAAGIDAAWTVIDLGLVDFGNVRTAPQPTMLITADGKDAAPGITVPPMRKANGHVFFVVPWTAPNVASSDVRVSVSLGNAYSTTVSTTFSTARPKLLVSALRQTSAGCFAFVGGDALSSDLGLPAPCGEWTTPLYAAVDEIELVIDFGAIDDIGAVTVPPPAVSLSADGVETSAGIVVSPLLRANKHIYFTAKLHAPATPTANAFLRTSVGVGSPVVIPFATVTPPISVDVVECPGPAACAPIGAVDTLHVRLSVPGDVPQTIALHSTVAGVVQSDPVAPVTTAVVGSHTEVVVPVQVPAAADGASWVLDAQLGATHQGAVPITIRSPKITASLTASGTVAAGSTVGLTVSAPQGIRPQQASYSTFLDASPIALDATLDLTDPDPANSAITRSTTLTAPAKPGTWTIDVSVAGYRAQTLSLNVQ